MFLFERPLIQGTMLKRKSQFTALVSLNGEEIIAHIPTTNRIGDPPDAVAAGAVALQHRGQHPGKLISCFQFFVDAFCICYLANYSLHSVGAAGIDFCQVIIELPREDLSPGSGLSAKLQQSVELCNIELNGNCGILDLTT